MMRYLHILIILNYFLIAAIASAELIEVSGDVSGIWAADTVKVVGQTIVPADQNLTIEPGTIVLFAGAYKLTIESNATLVAEGTATDSIKFDGFSPSIYWSGIRFLYSSSSSHMSYCIVRQGDAAGSDTNGGGIRIDHCDLSITHCTIEYCSANNYGGGIYAAYSEVDISHCTLSNNFSNDGGGGAHIGHSTFAFTDNLVLDNGTYDDGGGLSTRESDVVITENVFDGNWCGLEGAGLNNYISSGIVSNNTVINNTATWGTPGGSAGGISSLANHGMLIQDNIVSHNEATSFGGGIKVSSSGFYESTLTGNEVTYNVAANRGAGIAAMEGIIVIQGNYIAYNECTGIGYAGYGGGIYMVPDTIQSVTDNVICHNSAISGGGVYLFGVYGTLSGNQIYNNVAQTTGGGFYCTGGASFLFDNDIVSNQTINGSGGGGYLSGDYQYVWSNIFSGNSAYSGAGLYIGGGSDLNFLDNEISFNTAAYSGGGLFLEGWNVQENFHDNTIRNNSAVTGGGIYAPSADGMFNNLILWGNAPDQLVTPAYLEVTYSDITGGCTGTGNFDLDPQFVSTEEPGSALLWGSPCIDSGDPIFQDRDLTVSDVGVSYFNQDMFLQFEATPFGIPIEIPAGGGIIDFQLTLSNCTLSQTTATIWCDVLLPNGSTTAPLIGPLQLIAEPESNLSRLRSQLIPANAPSGSYHYNAHVVCEGDTSISSFFFFKMGEANHGTILGWENTGEEFETCENSTQIFDSDLVIVSPNPFNPTTAISYQLSAFSHVNLSVYDVSGRRVSTLVDGYREVGAHKVTFDGTGLASGVYLYQLVAGSQIAIGKMVLIK